MPLHQDILVHFIVETKVIQVQLQTHLLTQIHEDILVLYSQLFLYNPDVVRVLSNVLLLK